MIMVKKLLEKDESQIAFMRCSAMFVLVLLISKEEIIAIKNNQISNMYLEVKLIMDSLFALQIQISPNLVKKAFHQVILLLVTRYLC